jgi:hypothetical protein
MKCLGATNGASENADSVEDCFELAKDASVMGFGYNTKQGKCFGVTAETAAMCDTLVVDENGKWDWYDVWCSEGLTSESLCLGEKVKPNNEGSLEGTVTFTNNLKKSKCDPDVCTMEEGVNSLESCVMMAQDAGLTYFGYNKKADTCSLCYDSADAGYTECVVDYAFDSKMKIYFVDCNDVSYIGAEYYCGLNEYSDSMGTMAEEQMKCATASNGDSMYATLAECNNFAKQRGFDFYSYREDLGLCYIANTEAEFTGCWNINTVTGIAWDTYAVCGDLDESISDEELACYGMESCVGEECFVPFKDMEQSWKCDGVTQNFQAVDFSECVEYTMMNSNKCTFMNFRTSNGACACVNECSPKQTNGNNWQIFLNCANVDHE